MGTAPDAALGGDTRHVAHDWGGEAGISETIVDAVAGCEGEPPDSLPPLETSINPEALEALFDTAGDRPRGSCVTFSYYGYTVVVQSTGRVLLRPR